MRQRFEARRAVHEALGVRVVRGQARVMTDLKYRGGAPVVHVGGPEIGQPTVMMRIVVPREEIVASPADAYECSRLND